MLLLDSITAPNSQVLHSNFLSLSTYLSSLPLSAHLTSFPLMPATSECSLLSLSGFLLLLIQLTFFIFHSSHLPSSSCHIGLSHLLHLFVFWSPFSLWYLPPPFPFISCSFSLCLNLKPASLLLWESICYLSHTSAWSPACFYTNHTEWFPFSLFFSCFLFVFLYLFLISLS